MKTRRPDRGSAAGQGADVQRASGVAGKRTLTEMLPVQHKLRANTIEPAAVSELAAQGLFGFIGLLMLGWTSAVLASCGFPRPADVPFPDESGSECSRDEDCHDVARPACFAGQCLSAADACQQGGGARIVFVSNRDGNAEIYRAYANGSMPRQLTSYNPPEMTSYVAPSPDGTAIAYIHENDVFVMTIDGRSPINLTKSAIKDERVEWSPDGKRLAVSTTDITGVPGAYMMMNDGSANVALHGSVGVSRDPSWWPDSSSVIFATQAVSESDIWQIPVSPPGQSGSPIVTVQMMGQSFSSPKVAPGSFALAFLFADAQHTNAFIAPTFGGMAQLLTTVSISDHEVVWSHDSSKLAIVRGNGQERTIYVVKSDGGGLVNLTSGTHPRWSPDDRYILFDTTRDGNPEVYRMDASGANQIDLSNTPYDDFGGEWVSCSK